MCSHDRAQPLFQTFLGGTDLQDHVHPVCHVLSKHDTTDIVKVINLETISEIILFVATCGSQVLPTNVW